MGIDVELTRANVVARERLKFVQLGKGNVSLIADGKKSRGRSTASSNAKGVRYFVHNATGHHARACPSRICKTCNSKGHSVKKCPTTSAYAAATAPAPAPDPAPAAATSIGARNSSNMIFDMILARCLASGASGKGVLASSVSESGIITVRWIMTWLILLTL